MAKQKLYLFEWINFGKYRTCPKKLKDILDTPEGLRWFRWLIERSWNFEATAEVIKYMEQKEEEYAGQLLQPAGGQ